LVPQMSVDIHIFLSFMMFLIPLRNLYVLYTEEKFISLAKKVRYWTPAYFSLMSAVAFTGFLLSAFFINFISFETIAMFVALLIIFITEIKKQKKIRAITSKELEAQQSFIAFAKKKYTSDVILLVLAMSVGFFA